jgi:hypothetical protein
MKEFEILLLEELIALMRTEKYRMEHITTTGNYAKNTYVYGADDAMRLILNRIEELRTEI